MELKQERMVQLHFEDVAYRRTSRIAMDYIKLLSLINNLSTAGVKEK
jgi:hypothetical protein